MKELDELASLSKKTGLKYNVKNNTPHLKDIIKYVIVINPKANLNWIDVSNITDMSWLFHGTRFEGDISEWDVSNVKDKSVMFYKSKFNGDISNWDVSNVEDMWHMFYKSPLEKNTPKWNK